METKNKNPSGRGASPRSPRAAKSTTTAKKSPLLSSARCACGGGCPRCRSEGQALPSTLRSELESRQHANFSDVRVHTDAHDVTSPLKARAVTQGQDIYFHPGQFRPETPEGKSLIAHELAHVRQAREPGRPVETESSISKPGDALERNADALARGATSSVLSAPAGIALRSPFDNESAEDAARRRRLLQSIDNARDKLIRLLTTRGLIENVEVATERNSVRGIIYGAHTAGTADEVFTSYTDRDARVRRIIRNLMEMGKLYRSAPISADFTAPVQQEGGEWQSTVEYPPGGDISSSNYGGGTEEWTDLQAAYERYRITQGQTGETYDSDWYYLDPSNRIVTGAARHAPRHGGGIQTGAYMVVPDIDNDPLNYWHLDGYTPIPRGATIVEFWHDDFGYYYMHDGVRIDVPSPWR